MAEEPERSVETSADRMVIAMRETAARLNGIIQSAMDAIITVDEHQDIVIFNPAAEKMFGCAAGNVLGTPLDQFIPSRFRDEHRAHIRQFGATGVTTRRMGGQSEIIGLRANGEEFPVEASISQTVVGGKKLYSVILRDVMRRRQAEAELRESREQLRHLSAALQATREEEQTRIARELHDELGQALTALKMDVAAIASELSPEQVGAINRTRDMTRLLENTVAAVRRIATRLRPLMLDDLGLVPTLGWLANDFSKRTGIDVDMSLPDPDIELDAKLSTVFFRVLQESLTNVARHSGANRVEVVLDCSTADMRLRVSDNGHGFDTSAVQGAKTFGLLGMRERAGMTGGNLTIDSKPGAGTSIELVVPLQG